MLTDVFINRYRNPLCLQPHVPPQLGSFFTQAAHIIFSDLEPALELGDGFFIGINQTLSREIGVSTLMGAGGLQVSARFLVERYDLWNDAHGSPDIFIKLRLSFIELVFRGAEEIAVAQKDEPASLKRGRIFSRNVAANAYRAGWISTVRKCIEELNCRLRQATLPIHYHNGLIQFTEDALSESQIADPFWEITRDAKWANVDRDIKEAVDRRDTGGRDPAGYAMRGLESAIKIISDQKGWTTGNEKGAANFIDNLQSKKNGHFIAAWEGDILKQMFKEIRNPLVHGEGNAPPLLMDPHQTNWVIESCMTWIKSLIKRS